MIFAELKRDMRAAMQGGKEEEKEYRSSYEIKPYWRFSKRTLSCMSRTLWSEEDKEDEEEDKEDARGSIFHIKQPLVYRYNYNNWL